MYTRGRQGLANKRASFNCFTHGLLKLTTLVTVEKKPIGNGYVSFTDHLLSLWAHKVYFDLLREKDSQHLLYLLHSI